MRQPKVAVGNPLWDVPVSMLVNALPGLHDVPDVARVRLRQIKHSDIAAFASSLRGLSFPSTAAPGTLPIRSLMDKAYFHRNSVAIGSPRAWLVIF